MKPETTNSNEWKWKVEDAVRTLIRAEEIKKDAKLLAAAQKKIKEQVVIGYEAPYYKLYAGNFLKRLEAQTFLPKLKKLGFLDAWIVSTSVTPEN